MNKVILMGRLVRDPDVKYANGGNSGQMCIASYTLAVDRRFRKEGEATADFLRCVSFGKAGEFAEKYFKQGTKVAVTGRLQTGSYTNKEGQKVYTTDVIVEEQEFAESKANSDSSQGGGYIPQSAPSASSASAEGFMNIPEGVNDDLPFKG